jgi:glycosyltransferase involved in cell wall biosynthesis
MKIFLASYPSLMLNRGGPTFKIIHLKKELDKLGVETHLFDMWDRDQIIQRTDLIHVFNASLSTFSLTENFKRFGARYVVNPIFFSNHSAKIIRTYLKLEKPFRKFFKRTYSDYFFTKEICDSAERVLPNTQAESELLIKALGVNKNKVQVIHNGVEERFYNADPELFEKKFGYKDFVLNVGHLGSIRKNGLNMIKALKQIDCPVVIAADVIKTEEGEKCLKEIENSKNIKLLKWLDHYDPILESAYAACNTFVLPTRYETPGRAALEAGLAGANIVITPNGGTKEYFENYVDYVDPFSVESIRKTVEKSLNTPKNNKLKEHIKKNFTWDIIAQQTIEMYKEIIS